MPAMRANWSRDDHDRIWEHFNSIAQAINPELYFSGSFNLATSGGTLNGGTAAWGGTAYIQRGPHGRVHFDAVLTVAANGAFVGQAIDGTAPITIPAGYRPVFNSYAPGLGVARLMGPERNAFVIYQPANHRLQIRMDAPSVNWAAGHAIAMSLSWVTHEAIPSSTPGTLFTGI